MRPSIIRLLKAALLITLFISTATMLFCIDGTADTEHGHISTGARIALLLKDLGINPYLIILIIAMLPIVELRGAIPAGIIFLELEWVPVIMFSIIGNMVPIFFILFLLKPVEKLFRKIPAFDRLFDWVFKRTMAKTTAVEKYEEAGLMLFVAIPLPVTGAWTGSLVSYLLKLNYWKSILFIFFGVLIAGGIVSTLTYAVDAALTHVTWLGWGIMGLLGAVLLFIVVKSVIQNRKAAAK
jgi:uncharacterized membrane protein